MWKEWKVISLHTNFFFFFLLCFLFSQICFDFQWDAWWMSCFVFHCNYYNSFYVWPSIKINKVSGRASYFYSLLWIFIINIVLKSFSVYLNWVHFASVLGPLVLLPSYPLWCVKLLISLWLITLRRRPGAGRHGIFYWMRGLPFLWYTFSVHKSSFITILRYNVWNWKIIIYCLINLEGLCINFAELFNSFFLFSGILVRNRSIICS